MKIKSPNTNVKRYFHNTFRPTPFIIVFFKIHFSSETSFEFIFLKHVLCEKHIRVLIFIDKLKKKKDIL